jgi:hypothetical protein
MQNTINCKKVNNNCEWSSPSNTNRSNPKYKLQCPHEKPNMIWRDTKVNNPRKFRCTDCNINDTSKKCKDLNIQSQTSTCHITNTGKDEKDTTNWNTNNTVIFNKSCKDTWYKS